MALAIENCGLIGDATRPPSSAATARSTGSACALRLGACVAALLGSVRVAAARPAPAQPGARRDHPPHGRLTRHRLATLRLPPHPRPLFLTIGIGVGILCTLALVAVSLATGNTAALIAAGITDLVGEFFLFYSLLRVGAHPAPRALPIALFRTASLR